jgi:hypothetical protein
LRCLSTWSVFSETWAPARQDFAPSLIAVLTSW